MDTNNLDKKSGKIIWVLLFATLLLGLAAGVYWYLILRDTTEPIREVTKTKVSTSSAQVATESTQPVDETAAIKKAVALKSAEAEANLDISISKIEGNFAKGSSNLKGEETGGGYFLATKVNGEWVVVHSGQDNPPCSAVNPYNFPATLAPECLDSNGNVVAR